LGKLRYSSTAPPFCDSLDTTFQFLALDASGLGEAARGNGSRELP